MDHEGHSIHLKIVEHLSSQCFFSTNTCFIYPYDSCKGFPIYNIAFYRKM